MILKQVAGQADELPHEVEQLLRQVETSTTHYEALGIRRSATNSEVKLAHKHIEALLQNARIALAGAPVSIDRCDDSALTDEPRERIVCAVNRVCQAFSVLSDTRKRVEYDRYAIVRTPAAQPAAAPALNDKSSEPDAASRAAVAAVTTSKGMALYTGKFEVDADDNRRRSHRYDLSISAQVVGYDRKAGKWEEAAETLDVSRTGLNIRLRHRVRHGVILHLTLQLPSGLSDYSRPDAPYGVYALVRRVEPSRKGVRVIGLEFIGQHPPAGYLDKPWATFQSRRWGGTDRRRKKRQERNDIIWIEYFTESMQCLLQEAGRTENVSQGGLRVHVKAAPPDFELLRVSYPDRGIESYAVVRNRYFGKDGFERLCLKFIDNDDLAERLAAGSKNNAQMDSSDSGQIEACAQEAAHSSTAGRPAKAALKNQKILVADDDQPLRKVLGKILTSAGYEVILVEDGKAAVEKTIIERPDLVITDGLMPKMHGFLVCRTIKELQPPPKVIMLTAVYTKMHYKWEAKEKYGADELMTKPFEVAELLDCIERHLSVPAGAESACV
ncbi:MAG TPA: response regulator [Blastocatellia bacterium]